MRGCCALRYEDTQRTALVGVEEVVQVLQCVHAQHQLAVRQHIVHVEPCNTGAPTVSTELVIRKYGLDAFGHCMYYCSMKDMHSGQTKPSSQSYNPSIVCSQYLEPESQE